MRTYVSVISLIMVVCVVLLSRWSVTIGKLVNNLVATSLVGELVRIPENSFGPDCGFGKDSTQLAAVGLLGDKAIGLQLESPSGWLELGQIYWALGQCPEALAASARSLSLYGTANNPAQWQFARMSYMLGHRNQAVSIFKTIGGARYVGELARHAQLSGDYGSALVLSALAVEINPSPEITDAFDSAADDLLNLWPSHAEDAWRQLILDTQPDQPTHWRAVGEASLLTGDVLVARDAFQRGLALSSSSYSFYLALARTSFKLGDLDGAILNYKLALNTKPSKSVMPYVKIAEIETTRGNYAEVEAWCNKARTIFPDSHWPDFTQGYAAFRLGRLDDSETLFLSAHSKAPSDPYSLVYIGSIKEERNNLVQAASYFEWAASLSPRPAEACDWLLKAGDLYQQVLVQSRADQAYEKGTVLCPNNPTLRERLKATRN